MGLEDTPGLSNPKVALSLSVESADNSLRLKEVNDETKGLRSSTIIRI
jgi:hypothetical protein